MGDRPETERALTWCKDIIAIKGDKKEQIRLKKEAELKQ